MSIKSVYDFPRELDKIAWRGGSTADGNFFLLQRGKESKMYHKHTDPCGHDVFVEMSYDKKKKVYICVKCGVTATKAKS